MHLTIVGIALLGIGLLMVVSGIHWMIKSRRQRRERVTGFDQETAELLMMPAHERLARDLAISRGYPEFVWQRFTPLAVSILIHRSVKDDFILQNPGRPLSGAPGQHP